MQTGAFTLFMAARPQSGLAALFDNFKFLARQNFCEANLGGLVKSYQILPSAANSKNLLKMRKGEKEGNLFQRANILKIVRTSRENLLTLL